MATSTSEKLNEAKFFLKHLKRNHLKPSANYYLSAFISSARSVLWIMRSEYHETDGWEAWYNSKSTTNEEALFLKKINDIRVRSEKKKCLTTKALMNLWIPEENITEDVTKFFEKYKGRKIEIELKVENNKVKTNVSDKQLTIGGKVDGIYRTVEEFPDEDIRDVCTKYIKWLEKIVMECEKIFSVDLDAVSERFKIKLNMNQ